MRHRENQRLAHPALTNFVCLGSTELQQLRILRFSFRQQRSAGIRALPDREEILVSSLGFGVIARRRVSARQTEMRQPSDRLVSYSPGMVKYLLELACSGAALVCGKIRLTAQINGNERKSEGRIALSQFVRCGRNERGNGLRAIAISQRDSGVSHWQIIELHNRIFWEVFCEVAGQLFGFRGIACKPQRDRRESHS